MPSSEEFRGKVVVITGASAGVGRATAWEFAKKGAKVVLLARGQAQLEATKREVERKGGEALCIQVDIADAQAVERAAEQAEQVFGPIDIWVNNAMIGIFAKFKDVTPEEYKRVTDVTYLGQVYGTLAALKRMQTRDRGAIILVGSALAYRGIPLQSAYCGAKHGIKGFFESLRCELINEKSNVHISMVQLPAVNTTQFGWVMDKLPNNPKPLGKVYQPEVAARAILFAATSHRREVWLGSAVYKTIFGNRIMPNFMDWYLANNAVDGQQSDEPKSASRKDYVWNPVDEDRGAHGTFGKDAATGSFTLWVAENRNKLLFATFTAVATFGAYWFATRNWSSLKQSFR